jgi:phospho-N-acetylmuramoyl-pentapeptide-transferase
MFYHFIYPLHVYLSGLNLFRYITFRTAFAVMISLLVFVIFGKRFIVWISDKTGKSIRPDTPESHKKKKGTPSMGGILIVAASIASTLLCANLLNPNIVVCLLTLFGFALIGFFDDYLKEVKKDGKGVTSRFKFTAQTILATGIAFYLYYHNPNSYLIGNTFGVSMKASEISIPFLSYSHFDLGWWYIPFAAFVIVASSNAVNMTDGLDGLAIGLTFFVVFSFTVLTYLSGHKGIAEYLKIPFVPHVGEIAVFTGALAGACLGFLWYNSHPAEIFMGDTGALSLGGVLGVIALLLKYEFLLAIIGGVFVAEALSVILQVASFKLRKKRIFKMAPLHHHFELLGWHENKVITRFWIAGAVLALIGIATLKIR